MGEKRTNETKNEGARIRIMPALPLVFAALLALDRITKLLAVRYLKDRPAKVLIPGVLELSYLENRGAAWGVLRGQQWIFWIITVAFLIFALYMLAKIPKNRRFLPLILVITGLCAGAVGNFIDRLANRYVVDFIYFSIIDFPIFNVADIYVTIAVIALVILVMFRYKDGEFDFLKKEKRDA